MTAPASELRVMSYNVQSLRMSVDALVDVIIDCRPDVVCLQEAPRFLMWRRRLNAFAGLCGLQIAAGHRRAGAVAVLVGPRVTVLDAAETRLRWRIGRHRRGVATVLLEFDGQRLAVSSVHMSLYADERVAHLTAVIAAAERHGGAVVIAGDINEQPGGATWHRFAGRYQDAYAVAPDGEELTFSATQPRRRIDAVFVDHALAVLGCGVPAHPRIPEASDHRPVLGRIAIGGRNSTGPTNSTG
ncbi:MAG: endonuclease/exonuclease/phosphatase family protein [Mycobacteriales bacterium]